MRYKIDFDTAINQLTPFFMRGRKLVLYLQALLYPLKAVNDEFVEYAKETRLDAQMTSQVILFEEYLTRKFRKYFANPDSRFVIESYKVIGTPLQLASSPNAKSTYIYTQEEETPTTKGNFIAYGERDGVDESTDDEVITNQCSFVVVAPAIKANCEITTDEYIELVRFLVDKYKLANKTYKIKY